MPYYKGDYYRGDYYRGDPFLGSVIAWGAKKLAGGAVGRAVGRAGSWIGRQVGGSGRAIARDLAPAAAAGAAGMALQRRLGGGELMPIPELGGFGFGGKKKYRRMNPLNPKALRRALRRAEGFEKFARKTVSGLRYGPKKFKSTRRAS